MGFRARLRLTTDRAAQSGWLRLGLALLACIAVTPRPAIAGTAAERPAAATQTFDAKGVVKEIRIAELRIVIAHEAIENYMAAMTMPFNVRDPAELAGLSAGDRVSFRLRVTDEESWVEQITRLGATAAPSAGPSLPGAHQAALDAQPPQPAQAERKPMPAEDGRPPTGKSALQPSHPRHPLMDFPFTNELGERITLGDFRGQALAITFFFTRCPIPDFCPRLSKNFETAARQLSSLPNAPTNWHFLSVSFDTEFDTPAVLRAYAERYHYDPKHWSFLTGPSDKIRELASLSDVTFEKDNGFFNHNFRTLVIDASGHLRVSFPIGGDLSDALTREMLKAAGGGT